MVICLSWYLRFFRCMINRFDEVLKIYNLTFEVLVLHIWNYSPETQFYWPLSKSATAVNLILDLVCLILIFFIVNFLHLVLFFFTLYLFLSFYPGLNKPQMHANIIGIFNSQNGLNHPSSSTFFYFQNIIVESIHIM